MRRGDKCQTLDRPGRGENVVLSSILNINMKELEGNVVLEFNVSRFIPKIINNHLGKKIRVVKWRWH